MDAGARGRRLLQRREYKAKVSEFIPKELEDGFSHDHKGQLVYELDLKKVGDKLKQGLKKIISGPIIAPTINQKDYQQRVRNKTTNELVPEANSAQMKAMQDAKLKKMEDDKVAEKKKKVDEACWKGYEKKGMKTMFGKRYPNCVKKTKKEEVQLEAKVDQGKDDDAKMNDRNQRTFGNRRGGKKSNQKYDDTRERRYNTEKGRGVKMRGKKDKTPINYKKRDSDKAVDEILGRKPKKEPTYLQKKARQVDIKRKIKSGYYEEVELEAKKSCGEGEYYCYDEQKCKPIPDGMKVGKDGMLVKEDMKGMSQKSGDKRSTESGAGMTAKGVAKYNRRTGGNLKTAVTTPPSKLKPGSKAAKRRKSFCARSKSWTGPRGKAARRRWNCSYEPELPMIIDEKKLYNGAPLSDRVAAWAKKINEGLTPGRNDFGLPTGLKTGGSKKNIEKKVNPKNLPVATASYEPQGEMIEMAGKYKGKINSDVLKNNPNLDPTKPGDYIKLKRLSAKVNKINERKMTSSEKDKKEKYVKGMKKVKGDFTKRYGKDGKSVMYATATKMAMKKEETLVEKPGDGYLGPTFGKNNNIGIPNPIRIAKDAVDQMNRANLKKVNTVNKISPNSATMPKFKQFNPTTSAAYKNLFQSHEPEGDMTEDFYRKKYTVKDGYKKTDKMTKSNKRSGDSKAQYRELHKDLRKYKLKKLKTEGSLHSWFKGSKSKDGKPGWVNVVTGGTCASDKKGEGTPKCVSSSKRASMTKAERLSASRRKKKADPGQQSKSGAAKPTYVATDKKKKKVDENAGPSTPVTRVGNGFLPNLGVGRLNDKKIRLKNNPLSGLPKV